MTHKDFKPMKPLEAIRPAHKPTDFLICSIYWFGIDPIDPYQYCCSNGVTVAAQTANWLICYGQYQNVCGLPSPNTVPTDTVEWCMRKAAEKYIEDNNLNCIDILNNEEK